MKAAEHGSTAHISCIICSHLELVGKKILLEIFKNDVLGSYSGYPTAYLTVASQSLSSAVLTFFQHSENLFAGIIQKAVSTVPTFEIILNNTGPS